MTPLKVIKSIAVTDSILTATDVAEADYPAWAAGTTYAAGVRVIVAAEHKVYESAQAGNVGHAPAASPDWWVEVSPTNPWKLFDLSTTTQTLIGASASAYYELAAGVAVNCVSLINISGVLSVRLRLTDPIFGVVYDKTADLADVPDEATWYSWFFEPRTEQTYFLATDLPSYPTAVLRVDITAGSSGAAVGGLIFGSLRSIGDGVQSGARLGIQDYSRKERNDFGDTVLVQRAYAKRASIDLLLKNSELDRVYSLLADVRATPCLWIASDRYSSLVIFGFFNTFEITIPYATRSECSLDIEGLI